MAKNIPLSHSYLCLKAYRCIQLLTDKQKECGWPEPLELHLESTGGTFTQTWQLQGKGWIYLPGDQKNGHEMLRLIRRKP